LHNCKYPSSNAKANEQPTEMEKVIVCRSYGKRTLSEKWKGTRMVLPGHQCLNIESRRKEKRNRD
jgi:hypothetical protein